MDIYFTTTVWWQHTCSWNTLRRHKTLARMLHV